MRGIAWRTAPHITDHGILEWMWLERRGRGPEAHEMLAVKERFVALLREAHAGSLRIRPIPGAPALFHTSELGSWMLRAATGGWEESARFKLWAAGLPAGVLAASSSDSPDRVHVFRLAAERAGAARGFEGRVVLVGDGLWDVRVARALGWRFVGVASGAGEARLRRAGARQVVANFTDLRAFVEALRASSSPSSP